MRHRFLTDDGNFDTYVGGRDLQDVLERNNDLLVTSIVKKSSHEDLESAAKYDGVSKCDVLRGDVHTANIRKDSVLIRAEKVYSSTRKCTRGESTVDERFRDERSPFKATA